MLLILIIGSFIAFVIYTFTKINSIYSDYNQSSSEIPAKYHMDEKFMLFNYINCLQNKSQSDYNKKKPLVNRPTKRPVKRSNRDRTTENNNFRVIRGNKQG